MSLQLYQIVLVVPDYEPSMNIIIITGNFGFNKIIIGNLDVLKMLNISLNKKYFKFLLFNIAFKLWAMTLISWDECYLIGLSEQDIIYSKW